MKQSDVRIVNLKMAANGGEFIFLSILMSRGDKLADEYYVSDSLMKVEEHHRQVQERKNKM